MELQLCLGTLIARFGQYLVVLVQGSAPCKAPHEPLFKCAILQNEAREIARHTVDELDPPRLPIRTQDCATS